MPRLNKYGQRYSGHQRKKKKFMGNQFTRRSKMVEQPNTPGSAPVNWSPSHEFISPEMDVDQEDTVCESEQSEEPCVQPLLHANNEVPNTKNQTRESKNETAKAEELSATTPVSTSTPKQASVKCELKGRRIVHLNEFIQQIQLLNEHPGPFHCNFSHMIIVNERFHGLISHITFKCSMCGFTRTVSTDSSNKMDVNTAAVAGALVTGSGHYQTEEFLGALDIPFMTGATYRKLEATVGKNIDATAHEVMEEAARKEASLAIENGDVDEQGVPLVPVIADGSWAKRSYRTKYNSCSGSAAIIGARSKEVLFLGVKNKYCTVCQRAQQKGEEPKEHTCFKNWSGTSSSMEPAIIYEGFKSSMELYGIKYNRLIGDGDSSVYQTLVSKRPYNDQPVEKVECSNHLLRNYAKKLKGLAENKHAGPITMRKLLGSKVVALRGAAKAASVHWHREEVDQNTKIKQLRHDIVNSPSHIFGQHTSCSSYFCKGAKEDEENRVPELIRAGLWSKIMEIVDQLARHSKSLVQRLTSNVVESFNNVIAKLVGGKRVNYCARGSYTARCLGAVVSCNSRSTLSKLHRVMLKKSPGFFTATMEMRRKKKILSAKKRESSRRRLFQNDGQTNKDYGIAASQVDMSPDEMEDATSNFLQRLMLTEEERNELEQSTIDQSENVQWLEERRKRLTASKFGSICKMKPHTSCRSTVTQLLYKPQFENAATSYGKANESAAIKLLEESRGYSVQRCGLFVDSQIPFLGATPDGLVGSTSLVEVKCPYSAKDLTPDEAIHSKKFKLWQYKKKTKLEIQKNPTLPEYYKVLNKNDDYYYQVQGQLHITKRDTCIFVLYTQKAPNLLVEIIPRDDEFWAAKMEPYLTRFYMHCILPELVDSRYRRSMEIREPPYILAAQTERANQQAKVDVAGGSHKDLDREVQDD